MTGAQYAYSYGGWVDADEWQERRCVRCGVIERQHKF